MKTYRCKGPFCTSPGEGTFVRRRRGHWRTCLISAGRKRVRGRHLLPLHALGRLGLGPALLWAGALLATIALACLPCSLRANPGNAASSRPRRIQPLGAFVKDFHGATARLSPLAKKLGVVWTVTNNGKTVVYANGAFSAGQLRLWTASGKPVLRKHKYLTAGPMERLVPGASFRLVIALRKYFQIPGLGSFKVTFWNSVWDRLAAQIPRQASIRTKLNLFTKLAAAGDIVNLESNALIVKIGPGGKLTWSVPGGGAAPKAVKVTPAPRPPAQPILPATGPVATLSALANAVRTANLTKVRALVDRTPAAKLILAEIPLAGQIDLFCRAVRQHLAFDPTPHLEKVYPSVGSLDKILTRLDLKSLRINGDQASVAVWGLNRARTKWVAGLTLLLRRVHGKWLYSGAAGFRLTRQQLAREGEFDRRLAKIFGGLTVQINNGKIKTLTQLNRVSTAELRRADAWYARPAGPDKQPRARGHGGGPAAQ